MRHIITVRVPTELQEFLSEQAKKHGVSRNALILQILWDWVKYQKKTNKYLLLPKKN